ncbi:MAG: hypothetical protein OXC79_10985 [Candidatus Poribacteria bacterium]|nr:hypothetical protein [Candidatus Poribacteria bacterium]
MMKTLFFTIVGLLCLSTVATAELSVEDLEKIRQIVNEAEVRLEKRITEIEAHLGKRMTEQSKRLDFQGTLIITLIGALIAFVGVPLAFIAYQQNSRTQQDNTIKAQAIEIQALREKFESLEKLLS